MQSDWKEIYKLTSERTNESEQKYKDIGGFVFATLSKEIKRPKKLIIKLKGIGSWFLRRRRMEILIKEFPPDYSKTFCDDFFGRIAFLSYENKKEIYETFIERLKDYELYLDKKKKIKNIRHETQKALESKKDSGESSPFDFTQYMGSDPSIPSKDQEDGRL